MTEKQPARGADSDPSDGARPNPRKSLVLPWEGDGDQLRGVVSLAAQVGESVELIIALAESALTPEIRSRVPAAIQLIPVPGIPQVGDLRRYGMLAASGDLISFVGARSDGPAAGEWQARLTAAKVEKPK